MLTKLAMASGEVGMESLHLHGASALIGGWLDDCVNLHAQRSHEGIQIGHGHHRVH